MKQALRFALEPLELPPFVRGTCGLSVGGEPQLRTIRRRSSGESMLGQAYRHFEVVVCDDSSSEGPCELIQGM
jgi:hypothetical protein